MVSFVDEEEAFDVILKHVEPGIKKNYISYLCPEPLFSGRPSWRFYKVSCVD